jgi:hypothetical protein
VHDEHQQIQLVFGVNEDGPLGDARRASDGICGGGSVTVAIEERARRFGDALLGIEFTFGARR